MNKEFLLPLVKIETMSSLEIAELTGKKHFHVLRDIRKMLSDLYDIEGTKMYSTDVKGVSVEFAENGMTKEIALDENHTLTLVAGYSSKLRKKVKGHWEQLKQAVLEANNAAA